MPFGSLMNCFKKTATDLAEDYGVPKQLVEGGIDAITNENDAEGQGEGAGKGFDVDQLLQSFTGKQQGGLTNLFDTLSGSLGGFENQASEKGVDPSLVSNILGLLGKGDGGSFDMGSMISMAQMLTQGGSSGGGASGFLNLIGGGNEGSNKLFEILVGLAKSFFAMKMGSNKSLQDWGAAGVGTDDSNTGKWADSLIGDLVFPDKKPKEIIEGDDDPKDKDTNDEDVKGWFDGHPEIGKMQKNVFDDIFDTKDEDTDETRDDEEVPLIPTPTGFQQDCSILDNASILFLNNKINLDLRKTWRFLYSTKTSDNDFVEFSKSIQYEGPTMIVVRTTNDLILGAFASTSWCESEGGWIGNADSFIFTLNPKMACLYSTGQDENFMFLDQGSYGLGMGGKIGKFGLGISPDLETLDYHEDVRTFDLPALPGGSSFEIDHIEVWGLGPQPRAEDERAKVQIRKPDLDIQDGNVDMNDLLGQIQ